MQTKLTIRSSDPEAAAPLLAACGLPTADLSDQTLQLLGAFDGSLLGVIGLQRCGDSGRLIIVGEEDEALLLPPSNGEEKTVDEALEIIEGVK